MEIRPSSPTSSRRVLCVDVTAGAFSRSAHSQRSPPLRPDAGPKKPSAHCRFQLGRTSQTVRRAGRQTVSSPPSVTPGRVGSGRRAWACGETTSSLFFVSAAGYVAVGRGALYASKTKGGCGLVGRELYHVASSSHPPPSPRSPPVPQLRSRRRGWREALRREREREQEQKHGGWGLHERERRTEKREKRLSRSHTLAGR